MHILFSLISLLAALLLLFVGERIVGPGGSLRTPFAVLAALAAAAALGNRLKTWSESKGETRTVLGRLVPAYVAAVVAMGLYGAVAEGSPVAVADEDLRTVLLLLSIVVGLAAFVPVILMELSLLSMAGAQRLEARRLIEAGRAGLAIAMVLAFVGFANYVANDRDTTVDMRTYRSLTPSAATVQMVRSLAEPVTVTLFFPPANDVGRSVAPYFEELADVSDQLTVQRLDRDREPARAKELRARKNGTIVISVGDTHESIPLDVKPKKARSKLKKLDGDFQKKLSKTTRDQKVAYFLVGHGERSTSPRDGDPPGLKIAKDLLGRMNFKVKKLGAKDGLGNAVPEDATLVLMAGPTVPLMDVEVTSLVDYVQGGGALMLLFEPDVEETSIVDPLLQALGVEVHHETLAHDRKYFPARGELEDRAFLATTRFATHDSTATLTKSSQIVFFVDQSGWLSKRADAPGDADIQFTVRSLAGTFADLDGDFMHATGSEKKDVYQLTSAIQLASADDDSVGGRAVVAADADAIGDFIMARSKGNQQWLYDSVRWLEDDIQLIGEVADIEDIPVQHTKEGETLWFWMTTAGVPLLLIGLGWGTTSMRRREATK